MLIHIQHSGEGPSMLLIRYIEVTFVFSSSEKNEPDFKLLLKGTVLLKIVTFVIFLFQSIILVCNGLGQG